jgi:chemotaxis protein CheZ
VTQTVDMSVLQREVAAIATYVAELRTAIDALRAPEMAGERLPTIRNDIAAVRDTTRSAADKILDTAEGVLISVSSGDMRSSDIESKMMELMEVCSFQDLNGQRLKRATDMIDAIEQRLGTFVESARASDGKAGRGDLHFVTERRNAERIVHGPGHKEALGQDAIDHLLAG